MASLPSTTAAAAPGSVGTLYHQWVLDDLIELARGVSHDFVNRPSIYRHVSANVADALMGLRQLTGVHTDWPDRTQRRQIYTPFFGRSFCAASAGLREAAIVFSESSNSSIAETLRQAFTDRAIALKALFEVVGGRPLAVAIAQTGAIFRQASEVLASEEVRRLFGPDHVSRNRPLGSPADPNLANLVEALSKSVGPLVTRLKLRGGLRAELQERGLGESDAAPTSRTISQPVAIAFQRTAFYGSATIEAVIAESFETHDSRSVDEAIRYAYSWAKGLQDLVPDFIQAWKDEQYRRSLTFLEQSLVPEHPAGQIELRGTELGARQEAFFAGGGTYTVKGEVCCCDTVQLCNTKEPICDTTPSLTGMCWPW
jgi:mersacidin/lichenicidin family type 2 lantibiotic